VFFLISLWLFDRDSFSPRKLYSATGSSLHLKAKYGAGYRLSLTAKNDQTADVKQVIERIVPHARLLDQVSGGSLVFQIPPLTSGASIHIAHVVRYCEDNPHGEFFFLG
jgi:hypothetical protein